MAEAVLAGYMDSGDQAFDTSPAVSVTPPRPRASLLQFDNFRTAYDATPGLKWQVEVIDRLSRLFKLPDRWDGYKAQRLRHEAGMFALLMLQSVMRPRTPVPQVVPTSTGGIQLEWHEKNIDLEIHITAPYECELWFEDLDTGDAQSVELSSDFTQIAEAVARLTSK